MIRLRRSRIVIFLALITSFLFYNLYSKTQAYEWAKTVATRPGGLYSGGNAVRPAGQDGDGDSKPETTSAAVPSSSVSPSQVEATSTPADKHGYPALELDTGLPPQAKTTQSPPLADIDPEALGKALGGPPTYGLPYASSSASTSTTIGVHWSKMSEHFPIPTESIIALPTAAAKQLPKVQHAFKAESATEKSKRQERQAQIVKTFKKSWDGYVKFAWMHDELSPKSGKFRDPFCGWAATLVDSLDTLIIMGLDKEFKHALEGLSQIDFTTTTRQQIPLFETTIRYLGGLLSAYDLSGQQHRIILNKAVELAEVLMGAFDTPNRMPQTYYSWRPTFMKFSHRAGTRVVMAELGSLSMEFTRLAQITQNNKYYDAIARITNELEEYQDRTKIPGLWPLYVDASGCKKPDSTHQLQDWKNTLDEELKSLADNAKVPTTTIVAGQAGAKNTEPHNDAPAPKFDHEANKGRIGGWDDKEVDRPEAGKVPTRHGDGPVIGKRQVGSVPGGLAAHEHEFLDSQKAGQADEMTGMPNAKVDCVPQGLESPPGAVSEDFGFGGMADSTYEYLPKQFALLGGLAPQYKSMYEKSIEAANKWLLFRPMTPKDEKILVLGTGKAAEPPKSPNSLNLNSELGHLLCFTGGMYGLGAKLFDRKEDLEIGKQLTDACVWAYSITATGIMPEGMILMPCDSLDDCKWNQTQWEDEIDPYPQNRVADGLAALEQLNIAKAEQNEAKLASASDGQAVGAFTKRESAESEREAKAEPGSISTKDTMRENKPDTTNGTGKSVRLEPTGTNPDSARVLEHAEYVEWRAKQNRLPKGVPYISGRKYILRPEAIESVFYMYRITGDPEWREKGWKMWEAVQLATDTNYGASAVLDVTQWTPDGNVAKTDEMESFWLAETLKYFYLLFSEESVINLDEWVLNTEAHPFKRPKA